MMTNQVIFTNISSVEQIFKFWFIHSNLMKFSNLTRFSLITHLLHIALVQIILFEWIDELYYIQCITIIKKHIFKFTPPPPPPLIPSKKFHQIFLVTSFKDKEQVFLIDSFISFTTIKEDAVLLKIILGTSLKRKRKTMTSQRRTRV